MFNKNYYEHAFAIATHLYFQQQEFYNLKTPSLHSLTSTVYTLSNDHKLQLFTLLSELFRFSDNTAGAIAFHANTLILLSDILIYASDEYGQPVGSPIKGIDSVEAYIAKLRVVLFLPLLPSSFEVAISNRAIIIEDIKAITSLVLANNVSFPIQVCYSNICL